MKTKGLTLFGNKLATTTAAVIAFLCVSFASLSISAQNVHGNRPPQSAVSQVIADGQLSGDTIVSFVNFYPGSEIFELEGHSALRIRTPQLDVAISYGMFNFDDPGFVYRFVKGETDYWVGMLPWQPFMAAYGSDGRRIVEHQLNMTPQQKQRLLQLVDDNLKPENATYRYNYVRDNCATRPLRIVELAMGDSIVLGHPEAGLDGEMSYRDVMRHYHRNYPWYQFGIDLCLGPGIDYVLDNRQKAFAPVVLDSQMAGAAVGGRALVARTVVHNDVAADNAVDGATPWYLTPMAVCCLLLAAAIALTVRDICRRRVTRWFDSAMFGLYGLLGLMIWYLVLCSQHEATSPNWLALWLNPLLLFLAVAVWIKRIQRLVIWCQIAIFAVLLVLICAWPFTGQSMNAAFVPMIAAELIRVANYVYINRQLLGKKQ